MNNTQNQKFKAVDILILVLSAFIFLILSFVPLINIEFQNDASALVSIFNTLFVQPVTAFLLLVIVLSFVGMGLMPVLRFLKPDLQALNTRPTTVSMLISLFQLNRSSLVNDTARLGVFFAITNMVSLFTLALATGDRITLLGSYSFIWVIGTLPLSVLSLIHLPDLWRMFGDGRVNWATQQPYISVEAGRLVGAQPRLDTTRPFYIGHGNEMHLVLFDEVRYVSACHACIYFDNQKPMIIGYNTILVNQQQVPIQQAQPLKPNDIIQIGQTLIRYND